MRLTADQALLASLDDVKVRLGFINSAGELESLQKADLIGIQAYWQSARGIPPELDRRLLPSGRSAVGRDLDQQEKKLMRSRVQRLIKERIGSDSS